MSKVTVGGGKLAGELNLFRRMIQIQSDHLENAKQTGLERERILDARIARSESI
jgi:hypothetical protein